MSWRDSVVMLLCVRQNSTELHHALPLLYGAYSSFFVILSEAMRFVRRRQEGLVEECGDGSECSCPMWSLNRLYRIAAASLGECSSGSGKIRPHREHT